MDRNYYMDDNNQAQYYGGNEPGGPIEDLLNGRVQAEALVREFQYGRSGDRRQLQVKRQRNVTLTWNAAALNPNLLGLGGPTDLPGGAFGITALNGPVDLVNMTNTQDQSDFQGLDIVGLGVDCDVQIYRNDGAGQEAQDGVLIQELRRRILSAFELATFPDSGQSNPRCGFTQLDVFDKRGGVGEGARAIILTPMRINSGARVQVRLPSTGVGGAAGVNIPLPLANAAGDSLIHVSFTFYFATLVGDPQQAGGQMIS